MRLDAVTSAREAFLDEVVADSYVLLRKITPLIALFSEDVTDITIDTEWSLGHVHLAVQCPRVGRWKITVRYDDDVHAAYIRYGKLPRYEAFDFNDVTHLLQQETFQEFVREANQEGRIWCARRGL